MAGPAIWVRDLRMAYGGREVVRGIDLEVAEGELLAFLGPNGRARRRRSRSSRATGGAPGATSRCSGSIRRRPTARGGGGSAWSCKESEQDPDLTVCETLAQYAGYYADPRPVAETIALVGLTDQTAQRAKRLSGGQQRRLDVALALIGDPDLLFLDEPTTGFDPGARRDAWEVVAGLRELGKTIFLTTHYMDEAQALADRLAIIVAGEIVAVGAPSELTTPGREVVR